MNYASKARSWENNQESLPGGPSHEPVRYHDRELSDAEKSVSVALSALQDGHADECIDIIESATTALDSLNTGPAATFRNRAEWLLEKMEGM